MAEHLEEIADDRPDEIPEALKTRPEVPDHLGPVLNAFFRLSRSRPVIFAGMTGVMVTRPIQVTEAIAMAAAVGWDASDFLHVIGPADALYVETLNRRTADGHR